MFNTYATAVLALEYGDLDWADIVKFGLPPATEDQADDPYALFAILQQNEES